MKSTKGGMMDSEESQDLRNGWGLLALIALVLAMLVLINFVPFVPLDLGEIGTRFLISLGLVAVCIVCELLSRRTSRRMLAEAKQTHS